MRRQIKVKILENGTLQFNNSGNPDEKRILSELADIARLLTGDPQGFVVEQHVHAHGHSHDLDHDHAQMQVGA